MEASNIKAMRYAIRDVYCILEKLNPYALHINDISVRRAFRGRVCRAKNIIDFALAEHKCEAKWILGAEYECAYCSHCGHQQWASWDSWREAVENIGAFHGEYKFCPNCGFEMKG